MEFTSCLQETEVSVDEHCCLSCFLKRKKGIGSFSTSLCFFRSRWRFCSGWMGGMKAGKERTIQLYSQGVNIVDNTSIPIAWEYGTLHQLVSLFQKSESLIFQLQYFIEILTPFFILKYCYKTSFKFHFACFVFSNV